jgi:RNA polymerase primary sigma factor
MTTSAAQRRERTLLRQAKRGDVQARRRLVQGYLPLVRRVASRYRDLGVGLDDLVQEGAVGLLDAIGRFDARRGADFTTFARWRIRRSVLNALTEQARIVRLPKQVVEQRRALAHTTDELTAANGHTPSVPDLAAATGLTTAVVNGAREVPPPPVSLDMPIADAVTLESVVTDPSAPDPETEAIAQEETLLVDAAVEHLPPRQRLVITRHFGFDGEAIPLSEIARELHVSPQRVRAIERAALHDLADELGPRLDREPPPRRRDLWETRRLAGGTPAGGLCLVTDGVGPAAPQTRRHRSST